MTAGTVALLLVVGVLIAAATALITITLFRQRAAAELARQIAQQTEAQRAQDVQAVIDRVKAVFADLSREALSSNSEQLLRLATERLTALTRESETKLDAKKQLIDEATKQIAARLTELSSAVQTLERDRREAQGALLQKLEQAARVTGELQTTTAQLREALANPQRRGQWGERMAEDVLRLAGFMEGVNYTKQRKTEQGKKPDFTFPLPQGRCVNMDVKFPLANYLKWLDAPDDGTRVQAADAFLKDVRARIREVTTREYIDPQNGTVDCVLVFIPNEQVYAFIHEHDPGLLDEAVQQKVVLCSPLTLYAFLTVLRQAAENAQVEQSSREILALLGAFNKEWGKFAELLDKLGEGLEKVMKQYEELASTRSRKLERQLAQIEAVRTQRQIALPYGEQPSAG